MKILEGKVISTKMINTVVVEVVRQVKHPLYKKLLKRSKRYKVETKGIAVKMGDSVKIVETKPISKDKHYILKQAMIIKSGENENPENVENLVQSTISANSDKPEIAKKTYKKRGLKK